MNDKRPVKVRLGIYHATVSTGWATSTITFSDQSGDIAPRIATLVIDRPSDLEYISVTGENMNLDLRVPTEVDPAHELERQLAVIYVRLNCWQHPLTGEKMSRAEMEWIRERGSIVPAKQLASDGANQRVWMHREWLEGFPETRVRRG